MGKSNDKKTGRSADGCCVYRFRTEEEGLILVKSSTAFESEWGGRI